MQDSIPMRITFAALAAAAIAAAPLAGCGASGDVTSFRNATSALEASVARHCGNAAAMADPAACGTELARYHDEVAPMIDRVDAMTPEMDQCMRSMGGERTADLGTGCAQMRAELQLHVQEGCASLDIAADKEEASRHCDAMNALTQRAMDRADLMQRMIATSPMGACGR